jgi:alkylation response protein AidB-like acyl-CoA dehydrogenase
MLSAGVRAALASLCERFWAEAASVDAGEMPVGRHLEALAAAGFYGVFAPPALGGLGLGQAEMCMLVEELSSCCLASTFVWVQHFRLLGSALEGVTPELQALVGPVARGELKGGVALTGLMPGPVHLRAVEVDGGWALTGEAPWVSGWGLVHKLFIAATGPDQDVVSVVVDAAPRPGLRAEPLRLVAANATRTVRLHFDRYFVPAAHVVNREALGRAGGPADRLRLNGSFALGVVRRCTALLGPSPLDTELSARRHQLDTASGPEMPRARAAASELAVRAAHALAVTRGSRSALVGDVAERLSREAAFLLVFGSRPAIKEAFLVTIGAVPA